MKPGVRLVKKDHRQWSLHRTFLLGSTSFVIPPEFNLDAGLTNPNQDKEGLPLGCTGYTQSELCQDEDKRAYNPRFTYDRGLTLSGINPDDPRFEKVGCDLRDSLKSTISYGLDDWRGTDPAAYVREGYYDVLDGATGDPFDATITAMWSQRRSVSVATLWQYEWFETQHGLITSVYIPNPKAPPHNFKICGVKMISGEAHLIAKPWIGPQYGDKGFAYFPRSIVNRMLAIEGAAAFTLAPKTETPQTVRLPLIDNLCSRLRILVKQIYG